MAINSSSDDDDDEANWLLDDNPVLNNGHYEFHRPRSVRTKKRLLKMVGVTLLVLLFTLICLLLIFYLPRAPMMEIVESELLEIQVVNFTASFKDTIQVENRNFGQIKLLSYNFTVYHDGVVVGFGHQLIEPVIGPLSFGNFTAHKTLSDSEEFPQLLTIIKECSEAGSFKLTTEAISTWSYLFSTRKLHLSSENVYPCSLADPRV